jgi:hypothetical protein
LRSTAKSGSTFDILFWAVTIVDCPREVHNVRLAIGSNAASVWWVNGAEVFGIYGDRQTVIDDGVSKRLVLTKGPNLVRAAVINGGGATDLPESRWHDTHERAGARAPSPGGEFDGLFKFRVGK